MEIVPLTKELLDDAAALFVQKFRKQRLAVPILPDRMKSKEEVQRKLTTLLEPSAGVAALEDGRLVGYLGWYIVDNFRGTNRKGAYSPVWAHASMSASSAIVYRGLYRSASSTWAQEGCQVHALSILANDHEAEKVWFWNGFGLAVVDAIRPITPLQRAIFHPLRIRKAESADLALVMQLDVEHWKHYTQPPVFMAPHQIEDEATYREYIDDPSNSIWLAFWDDDAIGFMRFESQSRGATEIVQSESTIAITGAYVRPQYRGRGASPALLDTALIDYQAQGFNRCSVVFESFNPEAAQFWMKYFEPVCYSLIRCPEA